MGLGAILFLLAGATLAAQPRPPDYNFYDSRMTGGPYPGLRVTFVRPADLESKPAGGDPETIARAFLEDRLGEAGVLGAGVSLLPLAHRYETPAAGLTHLVFQRHYAGIPVFQGEILVHVARDGRVLRMHPGTPWPAGGTPRLAASLGAGEAAAAALRDLLPAVSLPEVRTLSPETGPERRTLLTSTALREAATARLVWFRRGVEAVLAWELSLHLDSARWYSALVDATTGELLFTHNLYRRSRPEGLVFQAGQTPHPNAGPPTLQPFTGWPAESGDCPAPLYPSQFRSGPLVNRCWASGTETAGNNVTACLDADGNNQCDWRAADPNAHFAFSFTNDYALAGNAATDRPAAVTNLFYWSNVLHDWFYRLGFDEPSGNFQADNFGRGGLGGDAVLADAQDGQRLNNATFATPPDGSAPRLQIGLFTDNGSFLRRDAAFDGDIVVHEAAHGLTTRLIGGPGNSNVLPLWQSGALGEGWSDALAASFTSDPVVGEYVSATPATGIRSVAYDNSPHTFGRFGTLYRRNIGPLGLVIDLPQVHRDGEIWATVLWDLRAALGKTDFERLVVAALKLTPARPSMLDAREAILQAAGAMGLGGSEACALWPVFAARGLGASAALNHVQGGLPSDTALSVFESFDVSTPCGGAQPQPGPTLFSDDVESGAAGWTAAGLWHITSRRSASGTKSWWYGQEAAGNYHTGGRNSGTLTSPPIVLPAGIRAVLEWDQIFQGEGFGLPYPVSSSGSDPYLNYDTGWVLASRDNGLTWETVTTLAHNSDGTTFDHHRIDLSRFAGSTILIRFFFDTLDGTGNLGEGWYLDDIRVTQLLLPDTPVLAVAPSSLAFTAPVSEEALVTTVRISNSGGGALNWTAAASSSGWLSVTPGSGAESAALTVTVQPVSLLPGAYSGSITVTAAGAAGWPATVPVTLTVAAPVARWDFEASGAAAGVWIEDAAGNGHHGTTRGYGSGAFSGVVGRGRALNGVSDWIEAPAAAAFSPDSFTHRIWVKLLSYPGAWGVVTSNYAGNYQGWYLGVTGAGRVIFSVASLPASSPWLLSAASLTLGRWYCITTTYDGDTRTGAIYINGLLDTQTTFAGFTPQSALPLTFGRASWHNGYYLHAVLDEARLEGLRLTSSQVAADYQRFPLPAAPEPNLPVPAEWRLDDTGAGLADASGNRRDGTYSGTAPAGGIRDSARTFNGSADYARVPASETFSPASFTIRAWVKLLSYPAAWGVVVSNYNGSYQGWYLGIHSSGRVIFSAASLPSSSPWLLSATTLSLDRWYHLAATYSAATRLATLYISGAADAQGVLPGFTPNTSADLYLARASWHNGYYLNGTVDEVRVEAAARTAAEIESDFAAFPPPPAAAVAEWRFDEPGSILSDASGQGHDATAFGAASAPGRRHLARSFNGLSDRAEVPASPDLSPPAFTLRLWVKLLASPAGWGVLVSNYGGNYQGWYLGIHETGRVIFSVSTLPASSPWLLSTGLLAPDIWHHVTATYDGATRLGTIYVNGAREAAATFPGFTPQAALPLTFGRASWHNGYYLNAVLDEVRLLPAAQSSAEIRDDYQAFP